MARHFDVIWIGTGQATFTVVSRLASAGKKLAIIEGGKFGGTCVNHGCTPTKTLVASAYAVHMAQRGDDFGFAAENVRIEFAKAMKTQQSNRNKASSGLESGLANFGEVFNGYAKFVDDRTVEVNGEQLTADMFVVHTGTRPVVPDVDGLESITYLTNETILDLPELPKHLVIVGGSYISLEFAQIFSRFGSDVTVLQRGPRLIKREDEDVSDAVESVLRGEGINIVTNAEIHSVAPIRSKSDGSNEVRIHFGVEGTSRSIDASHVLFATGRIPNSDSVNAKAAGLNMTPRGHIEVNEVTQTNKEHIFAIGDVNGRGGFTHTAVNDGEVFWDHYARTLGISEDVAELDRRIEHRNTIYSMFIDPPLARVGMSESEARVSGRNVLLATSPMSSIARAREKRETNGLVKILVDADSEEVLGATIFGTGGDEVIGAFAVFMQTGQSWKKFRRIVFPHPTVSELMPWILDGLKPLGAAEGD